MLLSCDNAAAAAAAAADDDGDFVIVADVKINV